MKWWIVDVMGLGSMRPLMGWGSFLQEKPYPDWAKWQMRSSKQTSLTWWISNRHWVLGQEQADL